MTLSGGVATFEVEYPATELLYFPGRIVVFSKQGTVYSEKVMDKIQ
jgi:hypothetical protein